MSWDIHYADSARRDLHDSYEYIADTLLEPPTAQKLVRLITSEISKLDEMPLRFRIYEHEPWRHRGLRFFPVKNYLVFYLPDEGTRTVYVVRIFYGGMDISKQLSEIVDI